MKNWLTWTSLALFGMFLGCATFPTTATSTNPIFVQTNNQEYVWESVVDVLHNYHFGIAREDRLSGLIETNYLVGAGILEPWHHDSVGCENKLESTFQSIRRKAVVSVQPAEGGYLVSVQVFKELEDAPAGLPNAPGTASFSDRVRLSSDFNTQGSSHDRQDSVWIPRGRDLELERALLVALQQRLTGGR